MYDSSIGAIFLEVLPVTEEEEDLDTVVLATKIAEEARHTLATQTEYVITPAPATGTRGDIIQIAGDLVQQAWNHKTEMAGVFTALITALTTLSKHRRISEIEVSRGNAKIVLKEVDRGTAEHLLRDFAEQAISEAGSTKVTPRVSKHRK